MVEAPRRIAPDKRDESETQVADSVGSSKKSKMSDGDDGTEISQVKATSKKDPWDGYEDDTAIFNSQVAATVNGAPILNGDILDRWGRELKKVRESMVKVCSDPKLQEPGQPLPTPRDFEQMRHAIIQRNIASHIHKKLLVERLKGSLKQEQMKQMQAHVDQAFEKEIDRLKKELEVSNRTELELELNKTGTTLQNIKDNFALEKLSTEYIVAKSDKPDPIERPDLIAYYQSNTDKFRFEAEVKWQQIQVTISDELDAKEARAKLEKAIAELRRGVPFEKVAKKYSDGLSAKEGGLRDWMEAGNLADEKLELKLFEMPINEISEIHEGASSLSVVKVIDRHTAGRKPFQEVQDEIRQTLTEQQWQNRPKKLLKELYSQAEIDTHYSYQAPQFAPDGT